MSIQDVYEAVLTYNMNDIAGILQKELDRGEALSEILNKGMIAAMDEIGERFKNGEIFIPEMLMAARVMQIGLDVLKPHLASGEVKKKGTVIMGTVKGDLHDIGKNLVIMMLEGAGFEVVDLGYDVPAERFIEAVKAHHAEIVGLSALLTTTMKAMEQTVAALKSAGLNIKIIVGGAPVTQGFADRIQADGYGENAVDAVALARKLQEEAT